MNFFSTNIENAGDFAVQKLKNYSTMVLVGTLSPNFETFWAPLLNIRNKNLIDFDFLSDLPMRHFSGLQFERFADQL